MSQMFPQRDHICSICKRFMVNILKTLAHFPVYIPIFICDLHGNYKAIS